MPKKTKVMDHAEHRQNLLDGVIKAGAIYDLGGITNQTISQMSGEPEAYIYRYFIDRDDLVQKAFFRSDENFFTTLTENVPILRDTSLPHFERFYKFMNVSWDYMVSDLTYCKFYIRYYYSNANTEAFREQHKAVCLPFFREIQDFFVSDVNADELMHRLFTTVIWNVMDIAIGITKDTPESRRRIFSWMLQSMKPYFKGR